MTSIPEPIQANMDDEPTGSENERSLLAWRWGAFAGFILCLFHSFKLFVFVSRIKESWREESCRLCHVNEETWLEYGWITPLPCWKLWRQTLWFRGDDYQDRSRLYPPNLWKEELARVAGPVVPSLCFETRSCTSCGGTSSILFKSPTLIHQNSYSGLQPKDPVILVSVLTMSSLQS